MYKHHPISLFVSVWFDDEVHRLISEEQLKGFKYCTAAKHDSYRSEIQLAKVKCSYS